MSLTIDMSPSMEKEALGFATMKGKTLEQMFLDYLQKELDRREEGRLRVQRFHELLAKKTKLTGAPYRFRRQDAYDEELA